MNKSTLLSVDRIARSDEFKPIVKRWGFSAVTQAIRQIQQNIRTSDCEANRLTLNDYRQRVLSLLRSEQHPGYHPVFNLTGTILHTNLGRAVLDPTLVARASRLATQPMTLEFDLASGRRGEREAVIRERLKILTGAESAVVVNNNAAAVLLVLNTLALNQGVIVSRGELIEIGGSFRLPEIMARAGCKLVEVGTTNRTRIQDYENALTNDTGILLKVHPSNYSISGFTESATEREIIALAKEREVPSVLDLGSGALIDLERFELPHEPKPSTAIKHGWNIVMFSGDKLLGGPQAGIIVGSRALCDQIAANPMKRALRLDKLALGLLDETLKAYEDPQTLTQHIKLFRDLSVSTKILQHRAHVVQQQLLDTLPDYTISIQPTESQLGSGAQPATTLPSVSVSIKHTKESALGLLEAKLRALDPAILGRRHKGQLVLDMRGADPLEDIELTLSQLS